MSKSPKKKSGSRAGKGGTRSLAVQVRTAKGRKTSSTKWLQRQLNDPYVQAAKREGYRSRAAYKLLEIDDKYNFLKRGCVVIDLGAAPGGWSQIAATRVHAGKAPGFVLGVDLLEIDAILDVTLLKADFMDDEALNLIDDILGGRKADIVLSDMAAPRAISKPMTCASSGFARRRWNLPKINWCPAGHFLPRYCKGVRKKPCWISSNVVLKKCAT